MASRYKLYNIDRQQSACFGGDPSPYDHCMVFDLTRTYMCRVTNKEQPVKVYSGTLEDCHKWMKAQA